MPREPKPIHVTLTRYVGPDGRRCDRSVPGARKVRGESESYYAWLTVDGRYKRVPLKTTDLGEAWIRLREKQRELLQRSRGLTDPTTDHAARPLAEHVADWLAHVAARGTSAKQIQLLRKSVTTLAALAKWGRLPHLSADSAVKALAALGEMRDARYPNGRGARTRNHYLSHLRQFARWATADGRMLRDPLGLVRPAGVQADRRHERRAPTDAEVGLLLSHLRGDPPARVRRGMTGPQRAVGYLAAMATGFRAMELRSLTRESFDLDRATATVKAAYDKRRRTATQPLPAWLVDELRTWFAAGGECWGRFPASGPGKVLTADLKAAGVAVRIDGPDGPLFLDMHSFRVYYISQLASQPGIDVKTLMTLARHSSPQLSLAVYAKSREENLRASVAQIPQPAQAPPKPGG